MPVFLRRSPKIRPSQAHSAAIWMQAEHEVALRMLLAGADEELSVLGLH